MQAIPGDVSEPRVKILKAVQDGDKTTIATLLKQDPSLIQAKTKSNNSSLLHIAAERGHEEICCSLIENGHDTNPIDKNGDTPYQRAKTDAIKKILVEKHTKFLCDKYYSSQKLEISRKPAIDTFKRNIEVMDMVHYRDFLNSKGINTQSFKCFVITLFKSERSQTPHLYNYFLNTIFREDILMTPYYGDLLVIHENEQAMQYIEFIEKSKTGTININEITTKMAPMIETRAFLKFVAKGLELFPFLREYPKVGDNFAVITAKKMFIAYGLGGLIQFYQSCTPQQQMALTELPYFESAILHTQDTISKENAEKNTKIVDELQQKFSMKSEATRQAKK